MRRERWHGRDRIDLGTQLLDRQILDPDGLAVGKVDDIELERGEEGALEVVGVVTGSSALDERMQPPERILLNALLRLGGGPDEPRHIALDELVDLTSSVTVSAAAAADAASPAEERFRRFVSRLPGADRASG
ncbi:hypothetical protein GCM10029992_42310 [Glycomyces albus]